MRLGWLNCNKRACLLRYSHHIQRVFSDSACDAWLLQEFRKNDSELPFHAEEYWLAFASRNIGVYLRRGLDPVKMEYRSDFFWVASVGNFNLGVMYLDHKSAGRVQQFQEISSLVDQNRPTLIGGDINTTLRPKDGIYDGRLSTWTKPKERLAIDRFLTNSGLTDPFDAHSRPPEFSYGSSRHGKQYMFRSDIVLCSHDIVGRVHIEYDHSTRIGAGSFTDHSAVIATLS
ncbi:endonuclease/exonuclease/phosphatase family protein [Methylobacterium trifolii]|uniref:Endonuclease/exonuclease/phosphatase domain-containing protein n=1 Tax=Methylobacterium trifolii TaxID=1003092 RepID=A0ABQ4TX78_9HYPH|nr:hypothetical protein MPOCJGCO_0284 [Methylobacterium trifolii]